MYIKKVVVDRSNIDGKGVFAVDDIQKDEIVWIFKNGYDISQSDDEFQKLSEEEKSHLAHTAYFSNWSGLWVYPPIGDVAEYTNHSTNNNLTVKFDPKISTEPIFIANRLIKAGEELTNNYHEFDAITREQKPKWSL